jgi:hypothetical protein
VGKKFSYVGEDMAKIWKGYGELDWELVRRFFV